MLKNSKQMEKLKNKIKEDKNNNSKINTKRINSNNINRINTNTKSNTKTNTKTNSKELTEARKRLKILCLWRLLDIFSFIFSVWHIYADYKSCKLEKTFSDMLRLKHLKEFACLHNQLRRDAVFYVSKNCSYGIFDTQLKIHKIKYGSFGISNAGILYMRKSLKLDANKVNFFLSDDFDLSDLQKNNKLAKKQNDVFVDKNKDYSKTKCYRIDLGFSSFADKGVVNEFMKLFEFVKKNKINSFECAEILYKRTKTNKYILHEFESKELFKRIEVEYFKPSKTMKDLRNIMNEIMYRFSTRGEFSDQAVEKVLNYMVKQGILTQKVDLAQFPDLLQIVMPFKLVFDKYDYWSKLEQKTIGFDLRRVKGSNLEALFNINVIEEYLKEGGVYIINEIVTYK